jgi:hypothetical protein
MIPVRFEPPRTQGTAEERLRTLEAWSRSTSERLNVMIDAMGDRVDLVSAVIAARPVYDGEVVAV